MVAKQTVGVWYGLVGLVSVDWSNLAYVYVAVNLGTVDSNFVVSQDSNTVTITAFRKVSLMEPNLGCRQILNDI